MPPESQTARELTRRLIGHEYAPADDPGGAVTTAREACDRVSMEFSRWVGARGYDALMSRALAEARRTHPALTPIQYSVRPEPGLSGVAESAERHGAGATADGLVALLETILAVLTRLIGDDLVMTFVKKSLENERRDDPGDERNLDQRSAAP